MTAKKQILIIGGNSFVARNFIRSQAGNYTIHTIVRKATGYQDEEVYPDFFDVSGERFKQVDVVINCAAIVHQKDKVADQVYDRINNELAVNLAQKAKTAGVTTFIQLSTIAVYGRQTHINSDTVGSPETPYGKSKLEADRRLAALNDPGFCVVSIRPPMVYGSIDAPGNMIRLIRFMAKGIPLPFKKLTNQRDFIHIDNLVGFIAAFIQQRVPGTFLVSDNAPVLISELYNVIVKQLGKSNRSFAMPGIGYKTIQAITPGVYDKLFGNLTIAIDETLKAVTYQPKPLLEQGIAEMVKGMNNKKK